MQYITSFLKYLEFERRNSQHTITSYRCDLKQFCEFLSEERIVSWNKVTSKVIRSWMVKMLGQGISARSVNRKIATLKTFYKFIMREGIIEDNPLDKVITPRIPKKLPVFIKENDMDLLLDEISFGEGYEACRDKLIIDIFYFTGMRLSELVGLKISQIDMSGGVIKVLGKRNKERIVPITRELKMSIERYLEVRGETFPVATGEVLFLTEKGLPAYSKLVYRIVNKYLKLVSTVNKKSPHVLRHTFATALLNRGADLNAIKEILGHSSLAATEVYTHNTFEKLNTIYKQAHPRA
ncbi:MAG: tyrosine-type recombinase/integrase [Marinilabiliaceae bacterium]|nr:tyrosine-type recombinase/integrase [Marinilabiliaceae bacterium]